ncbi:MAG: hypothetical protein IPH11_14630 [Ignavibacteriales bacterium]|nr:hypothetical protein [Ignavibacteriales bacterium]
MLLNRKNIFPLCGIIAMLITTCSDKEEDPAFIENLDKPAFVLEQAKNVIGDNVKFAVKGNFLPDSAIEVGAAYEFSNPSEWGIKFYLLSVVGGKLQKTFETELLDGSLKECLIDKIKMKGFNHELIYYNSKSYFFGSGGGEVYSYIIDLSAKEIYSAHLLSERSSNSLSLSSNVGDTPLKAFFVGLFKKDFPTLSLSEDAK